MRAGRVPNAPAAAPPSSAPSGVRPNAEEVDGGNDSALKRNRSDGLPDRHDRDVDGLTEDAVQEVDSDQGGDRIGPGTTSARRAQHDEVRDEGGEGELVDARRKRHRTERTVADHDPQSLPDLSQYAAGRTVVRRNRIEPADAPDGEEGDHEEEGSCQYGDRCRQQLPQSTAKRGPGDLCGRVVAFQHAVALGKLIPPNEPRERRLVRDVEAHTGGQRVLGWPGISTLQDLDSPEEFTCLHLVSRLSSWLAD
jgi:hypothetical protein